MFSFRWGKTKLRIITEARSSTPIDNSPVYAEGVHMLDGLTDEEMNSFLEAHPAIVPLFEVDLHSAVEPYVANYIKHDEPYEPDPTSMKELQQARDALERDLEILQRVKASTLEDVNLGSLEAPQIVKIAKDLAINDRSALITLLTCQE